MQYQVLESKLESGIGNELFPLPTCTLAAWQTAHVITFFPSLYNVFPFRVLKTKVWILKLGNKNTNLYQRSTTTLSICDCIGFQQFLIISVKVLCSTAIP